MTKEDVYVAFLLGIAIGGILIACLNSVLDKL